MSEGSVSTSWQVRWWHALAGAFRPALRDLTPLEAAQAAQLAVQEADLKQLRALLESRESAIRVMGQEMDLLQLVYQRDKERVQTEIAIEVARRGFAQQRQGGESILG